MCLGCPGEVLAIEGALAVIDCWGIRKTVRVDGVAERVRVGDFVIEHEGLVVRRIPPDDVDRTLELYESVLAEA